MDRNTLQYLKEKVLKCEQIEKAIVYRKGVLDILLSSKKARAFRMVCEVADRETDAILRERDEIIHFDFCAQMEARAIELLNAEIAQLEEMLAKI